MAQFVSAGYDRRNTYKILILLQKGEPIEQKLGSGRLTVLSNRRIKQKLKRKTKGKVTISFRALGQEIGVTGQSIKKYLVKMDIPMRMRQFKQVESEK